MKRCNFEKNDILAYCYQELSSKKTTEINEHLKFCEQCSSQVKKFQKILNLVTKQKLKEIPEGLLDNYTQEIRSELSPKTGIVFSLKERVANVLDKLSFVFPPKLIPVTVTIGLAVFVFVALRQGKIGSVNSINRDIALLEQIGEEIQEAFLLEGDEVELLEAVKISDEIILAQALEEVDMEDLLYDLEILQELEEVITEDDDIVEDLEILDELEIESALG